MQRRGNAVRLALTGLLVCVTCAALTLLVVNAAPRLVAILLGLEHAGRLEDVLPPDPPPLTWDSSRLDHVELLLPPRLVEPLSLTQADLEGLEIIGDTTTPGVSTYLLTLDEASLNEFLRRWFLPAGAEAPPGLRPEGAINDRFRDLWIDLQPGGLILYADVNVGLHWQRMGLLLFQIETALIPAGLVLDKDLYALPDDGFLAQAIPSVQSISEQALEDLTLVGPLPGEASVSQMQFHADQLQILAQATYPIPTPPDTGWQLLEPGVELRQSDVPAIGDILERLTIVRLDPAQVRFRVRYDPTNQRPVSAWAEGSQPLLVINGGYFTPENEATGLLISQGQSWGAPLGDFAGLFAVTSDEQVSVRWLRERPYDPGEPLAEAIQSFPVLVKPGGVMGFPADADEGTPARRTVVAQDRSGSILVIVASRGYLSLHEMAVFLADSDLEVDVALNLDGGRSTGLWLKAGEVNVTIDSVLPVPSVILTERR
jgi:uncharacterized protein YigE (DUF2233 family)